MTMTMVERVKILAGITGQDEDTQILLLLEDALAWMASYTGRRNWQSDIGGLPHELRPVHARLAVIMYNRLGLEGMTTASEGGVSRTFEAIPEDIRRALNGWRIARILPLSGSNGTTASTEGDSVAAIC